MDAIESSWCSGLPTARVAGGSISPYITFSLPKQETKNACFRLTPPQLPVPAIGFIHKNNKTNNARKTIKIYGQPDFCKGDCSELKLACANLSGVKLGV